MYVMHYASILRCWHLVWILVRTNHRCLGVGCHNACIILHNMIIDDERDGGYDDNYHTVTSIIAPPITYEAPDSLTTIFQRKAHLTSGLMFLNLQSDLIEHV
jgi:hypothetical protein